MIENSFLHRYRECVRVVHGDVATRIKQNNFDWNAAQSMIQAPRNDGNLKGSAQLSCYDLLNKPWVPDWFKTEQIFTMPHNQLREGLIHLRCLQMFDNGEQIGEKMLHAMKTINEKNQMYHQQHAREPRMQHMHPLSPAGGTLMQEGGAHFASARETKRGTPGYPDETKDDPFAVFPLLANPALPPSFFATTSTHVLPAPVVLAAASMIPAAKAMPAVAHAKTHAQTAVALDMQTGVGTKRRASDIGGGGTSMSAAKKSKSSGGTKSGGGGGLGRVA